MRIDANAGHLSFIEAFQKEAPVVAENRRLHNQDSRYPRRLSFHRL
jgi:hypothetical protein